MAQDPHRLSLHRLRPQRTQVGRSVPGVRRVEHAGRRGRGARSSGCASGRSVPVAEVSLPIDQVDAVDWVPLPTGIPEIDRVLGGGFVPGSVTLLGGEPGIGKSTLLLQIVGAIAARAPRCSTCRPRRSPQQVQARAARLGALAPDLWLVPRATLAAIVDTHRRDGARGRRRRLHPDRGRSRAVVHAGLGRRRCATARIAWSRSRRRATCRVVLSATSPRTARSPGPRARASRRHGVVLRGRPPPRAAGAARRQAPLRPHQRARRVRDGAGGPASRVPDPSRAVPRRPGGRHRGSVLVPIVDGHRPFLVEVQALVAHSNSGAALGAGCRRGPPRRSCSRCSRARGRATWRT